MTIDPFFIDQYVINPSITSFYSKRIYLYSKVSRSKITVFMDCGHFLIKFPNNFTVILADYIQYVKFASPICSNNNKKFVINF